MLPTTTQLQSSYSQTSGDGAAALKIKAETLQVSTQTSSYPGDFLSFKSPDDPDWEKTLSALQDQVLSVLQGIDREKADVAVGKTSIRNDKAAVVLTWNNKLLKPELAEPLKAAIEGQEEEEEEDGVMLYLAIRYQKPQLEESNDANANGDITDLEVSDEKKDGEVKKEEDEIASDKDKADEIESPDPLVHQESDENNNTEEAVANGVDANDGNAAKDVADSPSDEVLPDKDEEAKVQSDDQEAQEAPEIKVKEMFVEDKGQAEAKEEAVSEVERPKDPLASTTSEDDEAYFTAGATSSDDANREDLTATAASEAKKKKSVRWKESLEEPRPPDQNNQKLFTTRNNNRAAVAAVRQSRIDAHRQEVLRRKERLQRMKSMDAERSTTAVASRRTSPTMVRTRSSSLESNDGIVTVLTSKLPEITGGRLSSVGRKLPEIKNMVRRMRSLHVPIKNNVWFPVGITDTSNSFNSLSNSEKYDITDLEDSSRHYFYFRSLPRVAPDFDPGPIKRENLSNSGGGGGD